MWNRWKKYKEIRKYSFLGWVNNMGDEFKKCSVFLRFVEHDGLAFSVIEALNLKNGFYTVSHLSIHIVIVVSMNS